MKALVTGGSRGIGKAIVELFRSKGVEVYSPTREELDLTKNFNLEKKQFDILINNAGINPLKNLDSITDDEVLQVNYKASLLLCQLCLPYMVEQGFGRILNIGSIWIDLAKPKRLAYSASKAALHSLTKAIVVEYGSKGILANTLSPGFIHTELTLQNNTPEEIYNIKEKIPTGRLGTPEEIAEVAYALTVTNTFIAGQNIVVDGGYSCTAH